MFLCPTMRRTMLTSNLDRVLRFFQIRTRNHHLLHADLARTGDNVRKIIRMCSFAVIDAPEHGITEIDANLRKGGSEPFATGGAEPGLRTDIDVI
jgi:hypothetical protein